MKKFFVDICLEIDAEDQDSAWDKVAAVVDSERFKILLKDYDVHDNDVTVSEPSEVW